MTFDPTEWNEGAAPGISAAELNRIEAGIEFVHTREVDGFAFQDGSMSISDLNYVNIASFNLNIPTSWNSWKCTAWGSYTAFAGVGDQGGYLTRILIDGTTGGTGRGRFSNPVEMDGFIVANLTGLTTTGFRSVELQMRSQGIDNFSVFFRHVYARAVRVS